MRWIRCCAALAAVAWLCVPAQADVLNTRINEIRIDQPGSTDPDEYFELVGDPNESLDDVWYVVIGDYTAGSGVVECIIDLTGYTINAEGFFVVAEETFTLGTADLTLAGENPLNFENSDNVTHLLVIGYDDAGYPLQSDLDTDDDCVLNLEPWVTELDRVAVIEEENPPVETECHYGSGLEIVGPQGLYAPGHVYRVPDGTGTWNMGQYDPEGGHDTPGEPNSDLTVTAGATMTLADAVGVQVVLDVQGSFSPQKWLLSVPGAGEGQLRDNTGVIAAPPAHRVQGTLYYDSPGGGWTGTTKFEFEGRDTYVTKGPANHVVCVQANKVVISEIMHFPGNEETVYEYIEVYNYSGTTVNLWGLGGDVLNTDATANLLGRSIPPATAGNKFRIIAPGGTDPEDEAFRCEWKLDEGDIIRVDDDTWQTLRADTALVALYADDGGEPTLLDAVFVDHTNAVKWVGFVIPDDIGHAIAVTFDIIEGYPFNSITNDGVPTPTGIAPWDKLGNTSGYINENVQVSESGLNWGSPGWIPIHNPGYVPPVDGCEYGECCLPDGSCVETFQLDCELNECGVWSYDDGLCSTPPLCDVSIPTGACCTLAGDCVEVTQCECEQLNPIGYQGDDVLCSSVTCPDPTGVVFNEIDYDNEELDTAEFIELLGPAGTDLTGWSIELYNGYGGGLYDTIALSGTIPVDKLYVIGSEDVPNVDLQFAGAQSDRLQNGSPDGMALVDDTNTVVASLAYEGSFVAEGGAADGQLLLDIGADDEGRAGSIQRIPNGGFWTETPNLTPGEDNFAIIGACCVGETCILSTTSECLTLAGFYQGDASTCGLDTCEDTCITIGEARTLGPGVGVHLCDVVVGSDFDLINSTSVKNFHIQDDTGGLTVFGGNAEIDAILDTPVVAGDMIDLFGTTDEYTAVMELVNGIDGVNGVLLELAAGPTYVGVTPTPVTLADFQDGSPTAEALESKLVELQCVIFEVADGVATFASGVNYVVRADGGQSAIVRVSTNNLDVVGEIIPTGWVNVIGVFGQYSWGAPDVGYELFIREMADLSTCDTPPSGACCDGGTGCDISNFYDCETSEPPGYFQGNDTDCDPNPCLPQGTCCLPSAACVITGEANCLANGGTDWNGDEPVDCDLITCTELDAITINEIRLDQPDSDDSEYFELHGPAGSPLWGLTYVVIGDGAGGSGVIECIIDLDEQQSIPVNGFFVAAESTFETEILGDVVDLEVAGDALNLENSDNTTHLLVTNFSGYDGQDLDTNDDGTLDIVPWSVELDRVAVIEEANPPTATEYHYGTIPAEIVGPDGNFAPGHVYRDVDGAGTWTVGTFDPIGVTDTPGCSNMGSGPCNVTGVRSYRVHGSGVGRLSLDMGFSGGVEPRAGGIVELEIDLDDTCGLTDVSVACSATWEGSASFSVDEATVTVTFDGALPDEAYCVVTLDCGADVCVRGLEGDIDRGGLVSTSDASIIKPKFGQTPSEASANVEFDYDVSGLISTSDFSQVKPKFGHAAPGCP